MGRSGGKRRKSHKGGKKKLKERDRVQQHHARESNGHMQSEVQEDEYEATRGEVDELLEQHMPLIEELRCHVVELDGGRLAKLHQGRYVEDIWLLRYVLSYHKGDTTGAWAKKAAACIQKFTEWRLEHNVSLTRIEAGGDPTDEPEVRNYIRCVRTHTNDGGPCNIALLKSCNIPALMDIMPFARVLQYHLEARHKDFVLCDRMTRRTRSLVKMTSVMDFKSCALMSLGDRRWLKSLGHTSTLASAYYPQLLVKTAIINAPNWLQMGMRMVKPFLSARSFEKIRVCGIVGHGAPEGTLRDQADIDIIQEMTPALLGGLLMLPPWEPQRNK